MSGLPMRPCFLGRACIAGSPLIGVSTAPSSAQTPAAHSECAGPWPLGPDRLRPSRPFPPSRDVAPVARGAPCAPRRTKPLCRASAFTVRRTLKRLSARCGGSSPITQSWSAWVSCLQRGGLGLSSVPRGRSHHRHSVAKTLQPETHWPTKRPRLFGCKPALTAAC